MQMVAFINRDAYRHKIKVRFDVVILSFILSNACESFDANVMVCRIHRFLCGFFFVIFGVFVGVGSCNHDRAPIYYAESINSKDGFWGFKCKDWSDWALGRCNSKTSNETAEMGWRVSKEYV